MVCPFSDEAALKADMGSEGFLVALKPAGFVTHSMGVFVEDDWLIEDSCSSQLNEVLNRRELAEVRVCGVHTPRIEALCVLVHADGILAVGGVADDTSERPDYDGWVIFVPLDHLFDSVKVCRFPQRIVAGELRDLGGDQLFALPPVHSLGELNGPGNCVVEATTLEICLVD